MRASYRAVEVNMGNTADTKLITTTMILYYNTQPLKQQQSSSLFETQSRKLLSSPLLIGYSATDMNWTLGSMKGMEIITQQQANNKTRW